LAGRTGPPSAVEEGDGDASSVGAGEVAAGPPTAGLAFVAAGLFFEGFM
jgi:hypothetical protein